MEENDIGWNWWTHKKFDTITSPYSAVISQGYQTVLDYLNGTAAEPSYDFARNALFEMAENLALEKCVYHPDVTAALFDENFTAAPAAYNDNRVPGTIAAVDFDLGSNGVAYSDADYKRERWDIWQPWNNGGQYRNDGVDIEPSEGSSHTPFNVGWIEDDEWLVYTIQVTTTGTYDVMLQVASPQENGLIRLYLDDQEIAGSVPVPATGGWQNWHELWIPDIYLSEGLYRLRVVMERGGFNLSTLKFVLRKAGNLDMLGEDAFYGQNYPNPFNASTSIPVTLGASAVVSLDIYDVTGRSIRTLVQKDLPDGSYVFDWDGTNEQGKKVSSGRYIYRLQINEQTGIKQMVFLK
jgi:hypothetical protein